MPAGGDGDDIVIVGRFAQDINLSWGVLPYFSGLGAFFLPSFTFGAISSQTNGNIVIAASAHKPKIVLAHLSLPQQIAVLSMIDHASNYPGLAEAFQKAHDQNVTLKIDLLDAAGPGGDYGTIQFNPYLQTFGGNYTFQPGSEVDITIYGRSLNTAGLESTFAFTIAHEFSHLLIDPLTHNFLQDDYNGRNPGQTYVQDVDHAVDTAIAGLSASTDYSDGLDMPRQTLGYGSGYGYGYQGTAGNNFFDDVSQGSGSSEFHTGAGQDIIASGDLSDMIYADGPGVKFISDFDGSFDFINWSLLPTAGDAVATVVGQNLYITIAGSNYAPQDDPNALVILGFDPAYPSYYPDAIIAADGTATPLYPQGGYNYAAGGRGSSDAANTALPGVITDGVHTVAIADLPPLSDIYGDFDGSAAQQFLTDHHFMHAGETVQEFLVALNAGQFLHPTQNGNDPMSLPLPLGDPTTVDKGGPTDNIIIGQYDHSHLPDQNVDMQMHVFQHALPPMIWDTL